MFHSQNKLKSQKANCCIVKTQTETRRGGQVIQDPQITFCQKSGMHIKDIFFLNKSQYFPLTHCVYMDKLVLPALNCILHN